MFVIAFFGAIITYFIKSNRSDVRRINKQGLPAYSINVCFYRNELVSRWLSERNRKRRRENKLNDAYPEVKVFHNN